MNNGDRDIATLNFRASTLMEGSTRCALVNASAQVAAGSQKLDSRSPKVVSCRITSMALAKQWVVAPEELIPKLPRVVNGLLSVVWMDCQGGVASK